LKKKPEHPLCAATLRNGSPCEHVAVEGDLCAPHARKAAKAEAEGPLSPEKIDGAADPQAEEVLEPVAEPVEVVPVESLRGELRAGLVTSETVELIRSNIIAGLSAVKEPFMTCAHCHRRSPVQIADLATRVSAAEKLLDQLDGKLKAESATVDQRLEALQREAGRDMDSCSDADLVLLMMGDGGELPSMKDTAHKLAKELLADRDAGSPREWLSANLTESERELLGRVSFESGNGWSGFPERIYELAEQVVSAPALA
jgi:hypothetical protein